jgi:hypothetical protein
MDYLVGIGCFILGVFIGGFFMTRKAEIVIKGLLKKLEKREKEYKTYLKELGND